MFLIYLTAGWVAGIAAGSLLHLPTEVWLLLLALPVVFLFLFWQDPILRKWHVVLLLFVLGALRYQLALPTEISQALKPFNDQGRASVMGVVVAEPDIRQAQTLVRVQVSKIRIGDEWQEVPGLALVSVPRDTPVNYGDEVKVDGTPETPPDGADFNYRDYLARENIFTLIRYAKLDTISVGNGDPFWTAIYSFKGQAKYAIAQLLPEPSAALLTGILLGDERGIPRQLQTAFANTNTAHIIAISGFNITIVIGILTLVLRRPAAALQVQVQNAATNPVQVQAARVTNNLIATLALLLFLLLYTLLVGASPSVVRACIMGALGVIALQLGRTSFALTSLAFAAFVMTLLNPYVLWDVGFQLSFLATLGLVIYVPRFRAWLENRFQTRVGQTRTRQLLRYFNDTLIVTAAAFLVTAPLLILYFHRVSLVGFLTNLLILPVQPAVMVLGGIATFLQMGANALAALPILPTLIGALAQSMAWGAFVCLQYTILVVQATAAIPFGSFPVERIDAPSVLVMYLALALVTWQGLRRTLTMFVSQVWLPVAVLAVVTIFIWTSALAAPDARTRVSFISAGAGDATLIRTANDERILINGTDEPSVLLSYLGTQLPPWDRRIDMVIATHPDNDNLASLNAVLERYTVGRVMQPPAPARPGVSYAKWQELLARYQMEAAVGVEETMVRAGDATIQVIHPDSGNDAAYAALRLQTNGKTFLLAPGVRQADGARMLKDGALFDADVAVLPNNVDGEWLEQVKPETVIFFAGRSPREQPSKEILDLLEGAVVLRTDERGTVTILLDGDVMLVQAEK